MRLDEAYFGTGFPHKELFEVFRARLLFAGAESPHFRISEEVAKADLDAIPEEARASDGLGPPPGARGEVGNRRRPPTIHPQQSETLRRRLSFTTTVPDMGDLGVHQLQHRLTRAQRKALSVSIIHPALKQRRARCSGHEGRRRAGADEAAPPDGFVLTRAPAGESPIDVNAIGVVVLDVLTEQSSQVVFTEDDQMIEKLATNRSHESFRGPVLPRTLQCGSLEMDSESRDGACNVRRKDRVVVEDEIAMRRVIGEGVSQLLDHPPSRRMSSDVEVEDTPSSVVEHEPT